MTETEHLTLFIYALCCLSAFVSLWCVAWGLFHLFGDKTAEKGSFKDVEFDNPRDYDLPSAWPCTSCGEMQMKEDYNHIEYIRGCPVCDDCLINEQDRIAAGLNCSWEEGGMNMPRDGRPSWVCDRCKDIQPGSSSPHHFPPNYVCYDCYEVEQDARREGREDGRTGYQRRDGF